MRISSWGTAGRAGGAVVLAVALTAACQKPVRTAGSPAESTESTVTGMPAAASAPAGGSAASAGAPASTGGPAGPASGAVVVPGPDEVSEMSVDALPADSGTCLGYNGLDGLNPPAEVKAGRFRAPSTDPVKVATGSNVDWGLDPYNNRSWQLWLHSLEWLGGLIKGYAQTGDASMLDLAAGITHDWLNDNKSTSGFDKNRREAISQGTKFRLMTMLCLRRHYRAGWLDDAIAGHAEWLSKPEHYSGPWNHGLDESMVLMTAGCTIGRKDLADTGYNRMVDSVLDPPGGARPAIDADGANNEQSTHYAVYNRTRWRMAIDAMRDCGRTVPAEIVRRHELMDEFIAWQTTPAGDQLQIGESYTAKIADIAQPGTGPLQYVITKGALGTKPSARARIYKAAGYVAGRSGWGDHGRRWEDEMSYTARFGPPRYAHGQYDHMEVTFFAKGRDILVPSGHIGYSDPTWRAWLRSPNAHNTLVVEKAKFQGGATTSLKSSRLQSGGDFFRFSDTAYSGTTRSRSVLVASDPDIMVVLDDAKSSTSRTVDQLWHLPAAFSAVTGKHGTVATAGPVKVHFLRVAVAGTTRLAAKVVRGSKSPLQGWMVPSARTTLPAPTVILPAQGKNVRLLTLIVPVQGDQKPVLKTTRSAKGGLRVEVTVSGRTLVFDVSSGGTLKRVR